MATALAHELNQPLTSVTNYVQGSAALLAANQDAQLAIIRDALESAGREALRAGAIVHRLREFVSRGELDRVIASPADLVAQAGTIGLTGAKANGISTEFAIPADLQPVLVDRIQIQQVLFNLFRNAVEALGGSGTISIGAQQDGSMIRFSVSDTGLGITPGKEEAVFDPYVTSKADGMGLGLAICRTIIDAHGGRLWCENAPEGGAVFHFTVPIAEAENG
jgi:two-component system sensor kinase FixL